ncbi:MAG: response regulator transcription factor [Verrucomicrobiota bacterium]
MIESPSSLQRIPATPAQAEGARIKKTVTRVLVVENHELVRRGLAALVNAEKDMATCGEIACNAGAAVAAVAALGPDVVVIDVSASRGEGMEAMQRIRKHDTGLRIVALAMSDRPDLVERVLNAGAAAFVIKTDVAARVLEAIRRSQKRTPAKEAAGEDAPENSRQLASRAGRCLDRIERQIVEMIGRGIATKAIAVRLGMSVAKVETYRRRIREKLNFPTATQFVQFCVQWTERAALTATREIQSQACAS